MVVTTPTENTRQIRGGLRAMDPTRDLRAIADLIAHAFADEMDERGRSALRELRWMARLSPLVWWWAQADPTFAESFNGFVWEEPSPTGKGSQIVGNVSLSRAPQSRQRWIICNVVVHNEYQARGIGRRLTEAAIAEARELGAQGVVLQVYQDNRRALRLYTTLGFQEATGETELRSDTVATVALLDAPGYCLRPSKAIASREVLELIRLTTPPVQQWLAPVKVSDYQPSWWIRLEQRIADLMAGRRVYHLQALKENQPVAMITVTAAFRQGNHHLTLRVHPDHTGQVEAALVSRALYMLAAIPARPVEAKVNKSHTAALKVLRDYGFKEQRTLLTLRRDLG
jgi:ribosomal protein S18 acetylase RimI-like enzyme